MTTLRVVAVGILTTLGTVTVLIMAANPPRPIAAADDQPSQSTVQLEFVGQLGGASMAVAARGEQAFLGAGPSVHVLDTAALGVPDIVDRTAPIGDVIHDLAISGDLLFGAAGTEGLRVFDIAQAAAVQPLTVMTTTGPAHGVAVSADLAFVIAPGSGVSVFSFQPNGSLERLVESSLPELTGHVSADPSGPVVALLDDGTAVTLSVTEGMTITVGTPFGANGAALAFDTCGGRLGIATDAGMDLYDMSGPAPALLSTWVGGPSTTVAVACDRAFVGGPDYGVVMLQLSDTSALVEIDTIDVSGWAADLAYANGRLSIASNRGRLAPANLLELAGALDIVDVSGTAPARRSLYEVPSGAVRDLVVDGTTVLIAEGSPDRGMPGRGWSVDLVDPSQPVPAGSAELVGTPYSVAAKYPNGFFTSSDGFLVTTMDAAGRLRPQQRIASLLLGDADLARHGAWLYAVGGAADLALLNLSIPLQVRRVPLGAQPDLRGARAVAVEAGRLYVGGEQGLFVLDVRTPSYPRTLARFPNLAPSVDIASFGSLVLSADRVDGLRILDTSQVSQITDLQLAPGPGLAAVATSQGYVYSLRSDGVMELLDVTNPASPVVAASADPPAFAKTGDGVPMSAQGADMVAAGNLALVGHPSAGLLVYRASGRPGPTPTPIIDPMLVYLPAVSLRSPPSPARFSMAEVATYGPLNTRSWGLDVVGHTAFVGREAGARPHVAVMDLSNPAVPAEVGRSPDLDGRPERLVYRDGFVYVVLGQNGMRILDVRDPAKVTSIGAFPTTREFTHLAVGADGKHAYLVETRSSGGETVLFIIDTSDPSSPIESGRIVVADNESAAGIVLLDDHAYLTFPTGIVAVDISNAIDPQVAGRFALTGAAEPAVTDAGAGPSQRNMVAVVNRGAGAMPGGLWLVDASRPRALEEAGSLVSLDWPEVEGARQLSWTGDRLLMASHDDLRLVDVTDFRGPRVIAQMLDQYSDIWEVVLTEQAVYFTDGSEGLVVVALTPDR